MSLLASLFIGTRNKPPLPRGISAFLAGTLSYTWHLFMYGLDNRPNRVLGHYILLGVGARMLEHTILPRAARILVCRFPTVILFSERYNIIYPTS